MNLKIEERKEWKRNEIMGGYIIVCKNDFIVGVITMFLNRFVHAARIIGSRWYVVSTSAEKDEKTIEDSYGEGKLFEYCRSFSDLLSIVKSFVNEHTNFKCLLKI